MNTLFSLKMSTIGWFEIIKDIVIPLLGIFSTLIIGIIIANLLRKREEKNKIKELLIDTYIQYLEARNNNIDFQIRYLRYEVLNRIIINHKVFFSDNTSYKMAFEAIKLRLDELQIEVKEIQNKSSDWSLFAFKFYFLIGKEKYSKVRIFENEILENLLKDNSLSNFSENITEQFKSNKNILKKLNSSDVFQIETAMHLIEDEVAKKYN